MVRSYRQILLTEHPALGKFFGERCPHLAGMIAYFGILSIIPAAFLLVSTLAAAGFLSTQGYLIDQLRFVMPQEGVDVITGTVDYLRNRSGSVGVIGAVGLVYGTSNFLSCIESALNIIYGVNNRMFLYQKALVLILMLLALVGMTASVIAASFVLPLIGHSDLFEGGFLDLTSTDALLSIGVSFAFAFIFLLSCYRFLPNREMHVRDVWRGALIGAALFELSIHMLPLYLASSGETVLVKAFAGALIVLIWFYLMALILLAGGVFNWWWEICHRHPGECDGKPRFGRFPRLRSLRSGGG